MRAKKSLGQHFLVDGEAIRNIVLAANLQPNDLVIEIGPGRGALTEFLVRSGAQVCAVEIDPDMCLLLKTQFGDQENFTLVEGDVQKVNLRELVTQSDCDRAVLVGNLPYQITGTLVRQILDARDVFRYAVIMVQREVARRMVAQPIGKDYGVLTAVTQIYCAPRLLFDLPPDAFAPPPKVHSSVLLLDFDCDPLFQVEDSDAFMKVVHAGFQQRRKMLRNTLRSLVGGDDVLLNEILEEAGVDGSLRPEAVSVDLFDQIARAWCKRR